MSSEFFAGLDLGQAQDYTALAIAERIMDRSDSPARYHVRHLQRFKLGTGYPEIVTDMKALLVREQLRERTSLVVDATGVGMPVVDLLKREDLDLVAVTITSGNEVTGEWGAYNVPKRDLVSTLAVLLQAGRLQVTEKLPEAAILVKEMLAFRVKITADAHDTYGAWRDGTHDDLVLAVALACWYGERFGAVRLWTSG